LSKGSWHDSTEADPVTTYFVNLQQPHDKEVLVSFLRHRPIAATKHTVCHLKVAPATGQ